MSEIATNALFGTIGIVLVLALAVLYRVAVGPTTQDRVLGVNVIGTSAVIVLSLLAAALHRPEFLDIAMVYASLNFVLSLVIARLTFQRGEVR